MLTHIEAKATQKSITAQQKEKKQNTNNTNTL